MPSTFVRLVRKATFVPTNKALAAKVTFVRLVINLAIAFGRASFLYLGMFTIRSGNGPGNPPSV